MDYYDFKENVIEKQKAKEAIDKINDLCQDQMDLIGKWTPECVLDDFRQKIENMFEKKLGI